MVVWCIFYLVGRTRLGRELVTLINLFIILLFVILYSYRHFLMMLFLGCDLKSVIHQDFDDVFTYTYPNLMSVENYWCRGLKGLVHLRPIKGVEVSSLDIGLEISQISMHKYFFYSLIIFILGVFSPFYDKSNRFIGIKVKQR